MDHPDLDLKPSRNPFDKYPVVAYRIEQEEHVEERFYIGQCDLTRDDLGPRMPPPEMSEAQARERLGQLGLSGDEIEARFAWARKWMATRMLTPNGSRPVSTEPPL